MTETLMVNAIIKNRELFINGFGMQHFAAFAQALPECGPFCPVRRNAKY